jgi:hypothetical protein
MQLHRTTSAIVLAALLFTVVPVRQARAEGSGGYLVYGLLIGALTALGILAYQADYGDDKPLETPDKSGRQEKRASLEVVAPPASGDEDRPQDYGAALALTARF